MVALPWLYEYYKPRGWNNLFTSRAKIALYSASGATAVPQVTLGNVKHSNGKSFSSWNTISIMYGGEWNGGFGRENTESVEYSAETGTTGDLSFFLSCQGAIPGIVPGSVSLALKTG